MKLKLLTPVLMLFLLISVSCKKNSSDSTTSSPENPKLENGIDSISYALGSLVGQDLKSGGFSKLNYDVLNAALQRGLNGDSMIMTKEDATMTLQRFAMAQMKNKSDENSKIAKDFLEKNKSAEGVKTTATGLQYKIIKQGTGATPTDTQKVKVHYTGKFIDGKVFDSSVSRGEPATFRVNQVIPGWTEALKMMTVGSKWQLFVPPTLGYGEQGNQGIPGNSLLIFEVELLGIEK